MPFEYDFYTGLTTRHGLLDLFRHLHPDRIEHNWARRAKLGYRYDHAHSSPVWPEVDVVCASEELALADYVRSIGDEKLVIDMLVGDLQRVVEYPELGFATDQHVPVGVTEAYDRLLRDGFDSRLLR
ncbi:MAG: hypothetical protein ABIQ18_45120 [Umezawaea sp.]